MNRHCFRWLFALFALSVAYSGIRAEAGERRWERQLRKRGLPENSLPQLCPPDARMQCGVLPSVQLPAQLPHVPAPAPIPAPRIATPPIPDKPKVAKPEVIQLGYSVKGIPILMQVFGTEGPVTFVFGAIHGNEPNSGHLARHLLDYLQENPSSYERRRVAVIPVANPDGLVRNLRLNDHKIDLNRNFPAANWAKSKPGQNFGGEAAASEPETQAIIKSVELLAPQRIISIHAITRGRECNNYDGPGADLANVMKSKNGYRVAKTIGYPTPGSFGSWAGVDRQIATITLELPVDLSGDACWEVHKEALLAAIQLP